MAARCAWAIKARRRLTASTHKGSFRLPEGYVAVGKDPLRPSTSTCAGLRGKLTTRAGHGLGGGRDSAAVPGTLVNLAAGGGRRDAVRFGHPSGTLQVGASVAEVDGRWTVTRAVMSRSARVLMEGWARVPADTLDA